MTATTQATLSTPKSVAQRASRKRFSFGPVWNAAVLAGTASDQPKLLAQAISLKAGSKSDLSKLKLATLRAKVAGRLEATHEAGDATEGNTTVAAVAAADTASA